MTGQLVSYCHYWLRHQDLKGEFGDLRIGAQKCQIDFQISDMSA
jgi:hypothetical protein